MLDGRRLLVAIALPRDQAQKVTQLKKTKEKIDKRNLHLVRESCE